MKHPAAHPRSQRLLDSLPAVYRETDEGVAHGELQWLLAAFEAVLIGPPDAPTAQGLEQAIAALPSLLAPDAEAGRSARHAGPGFDHDIRDAIVPWIAARWAAFTPFAHFEPARLRRIVERILPLYARRGTPAYLLALLRLCFDEEIAAIALQEHLGGGLRVGQAQVGRTTLLGSMRAFTFRLEIQLHLRTEGWSERQHARLRAAITAIVEFAKPAHTCCELQVGWAQKQPAGNGP